MWDTRVEEGVWREGHRGGPREGSEALQLLSDPLCFPSRAPLDSEGTEGCSQMGSGTHGELG